MTLFVLVLFDLTAVGDTADHDILLSGLEQWVGIKDTALEWFRFYLADQTFCVSLGDYRSSSALILCGVPQGSVSGLLLFCLHLISLGSILKKRSISFSCCAHCSQIYFPYTRLLNKFLDDISPILASLLWLPVHFRIHFKFVLFLKPSVVFPSPTSLSCYILIHPHSGQLTSCFSVSLKLSVSSEWTALSLLFLWICLCTLNRWFYFYIFSLNLSLLFDLMFLTLFILSLVILMYGCYFVMWYIFYLLPLWRRLMIPQKVLNILQ